MEIKDFLVDESVSIISAMRQLDNVARKVLFVTKSGEFIGTITDGDIRRWILKKGSLEEPVKKIANYSPKFVYENEISRAKEVMDVEALEAIPVINNNNQVVTVVFRYDRTTKRIKTLNVPVVIMAGGLGTRLYPYTKILPKALIPVGEIPITEHIINRFHQQISNQFYIIVNHKKNMIKSYFNDITKAYEIDYIDEDIPLGTGGGLGLLKDKINQTFILHNCDILIESDYEKIYKHHKKEKNFITMVCSLKNIKIPYGVIDISENGEVEAIKEKPEFSIFTNTGMYVVEPEVIYDLKSNEKTHFTEIIEKYRAMNKRIGVYPVSEYSWLDMGQLDELDEMRRRLDCE